MRDLGAQFAYGDCWLFGLLCVGIFALTLGFVIKGYIQDGIVPDPEVILIFGIPSVCALVSWRSYRQFRQYLAVDIKDETQKLPL